MSDKKVKILLIEDDPDQIVLYSAKFELEGLNLIIAKDGPEGLAKAAKEKPDFILLDIVMEEMDGMEVLKRLKANKKTRKIPVAILTNLITKDLIAKSKKFKVVGFWSKTEVLPQDVVDRIKRMLNIK